MKSCSLPIIFILMSLPCYLIGQTNGNVGIGTSTPSARLQVNAKSSASNATLVLMDSAGGKGPTIRFNHTSSMQALSITGNTTGTESNKGIILSWIDDSLLWLKPNGALGLGTNNPQARMQVNHRSSGNNPTLVLADSAVGLGATLQFRKIGSTDFLGITGNTTGSDANKGIIMSWIDDSLLWLKPNGALGLGTNNPQARMQVNHRSSGNNPTLVLADSAVGLGATLQFRKIGSTDFLGITGNTTGSDANKGIIMSFKDDSLLWLKPNGALGLGTNNPQARMQINHRSTANSPTLMMVDSAMGLGATLQFRKQGSTDFFGITGNTTGSNANKGIIMSWRDDSLLWLKPNGALGIGTNNPVAKLDINGSMRLNGALIAGTSIGQPGQILTSNGVNNPPSWEDLNAGEQDPDTLAFHAYENTSKSVPSGVAGMIISSGTLERFDKGNGFNTANGFFDVFLGDYGDFHFDAKVSLTVGTPDDPPFVAKLSLEIVAQDGTTILRTADENLYIPFGVPNGTPFTLRSSTTQRLDPNQKVRVRFSHNRGSNLNVKLEEFSGFSL